VLGSAFDRTNVPAAVEKEQESIKRERVVSQCKHDEFCIIQSCLRVQDLDVSANGLR
jgi:hypothetical protein